MLRLDKNHLHRIHNATELEHLEESLQLAIELEHSTIPPYLTAMYSLKPGYNNEIRKILHSIIAEEMLHMCIAANILNAIGGEPEINKPDFIPNYPGELPLGIAGHLIVGLEKFSKKLVKDKFMVIEEPENPIEMPNGPAEIQDHEHTIGAYYLSLKKKITELHQDKLPGDPSRQITMGFSADLLFPVITTTDALNAIEVIIEQGEGTAVSPIDQEGDLAHYYKFEEVYYGKKIVPDPTAVCGYGFTGDEIKFDEAGVYPIFPNTKLSMLEAGSPEYLLLEKFNREYSDLLNVLHLTYNGEPDYMSTAFQLMGAIAKSAAEICSTPFPGKPGYNLGLPFEFMAESGN